MDAASRWSPMRIARGALSAGLLASFAMAQPALSLTDTTTGQTWSSSPAELFVGHAVSFDVSGTPSDLAVLLVSATPPPTPPPVFGGVPLGVDPTRAVVLLGPATIGASGSVSLPLNVPSWLPTGAQLFFQAAVVDAAVTSFGLTNGLVATTQSEPFTELLSGVQSGHPLAGSGGTTVVTDAASWSAFWTQHASFIFPSPPPPTVDFSQHAVLAVFAGARPSSGYAIAIDEVRYARTTLQVNSTENAPGAGCGVLTVITFPFQFVTIPRQVATPTQTLWTRTFQYTCP